MKTITLIFFFLISVFPCLAQTPIDSIFHLIEKSGNEKKQTEWLFEICKIAHETNDASSIEYLHNLHGRIEKTDDELKAAIYHFSGSVYRAGGDYEKALEFDLKALKISEILEDTKLQAKLLNNIGIDFYRLTNYDKALSYFSQAQLIYNQIDDTLGMGDSYNNIGMIYDDMHKPDSALIFYQNAYNLFLEIDRKDAVADVLNNLAGVYYQKAEFDKVLKYALQSLDIQKEIGNEHKISYTLINIGVLYFSLGNYSKAIEYELEGIAIAQKIGSLPFIRFGCKNIAEAYSKIGDYEKAYKYHVEYAAANDSIFNKDMVTSMNEMQTKYETEKKEQQIEILEQKSKIDNLKYQRIRLFGLSLLVVLILILVIIVILYRQNKQKALTNELLSDKNEELKVLNATKDKFFAIISHDLKNPLSGFYAITNSIDDYFEDINKDDLHTYIRELRTSSRQLKDLLYDLLQWAALQTKEIAETPQEVNINKLVEETISFLQASIKEKKHRISNKISYNTVVNIDNNMISVIFRNLIANAIKFTPENGEISIYEQNFNNQIKFFVKDSGIGMSENDMKKLFRIDIDTKTIGSSPEKGTGLGLILVKEMVEKLNGQIKVESKIGKGSTFIIILPFDMPKDGKNTHNHS